MLLVFYISKTFVNVYWQLNLAAADTTNQVYDHCQNSQSNYNNNNAESPVLKLEAARRKCVTTAFEIEQRV